MSNGDKCVCGDKETWHKKCYAEQAEASSLSDLLVAKKDETITRLRGQLQNCVNLLHRMKRHGNASDGMVADKAIDSANKALYETLIA